MALTLGALVRGIARAILVLLRDGLVNHADHKSAGFGAGDDTANWWGSGEVKSRGGAQTALRPI